MLTLEKIHEMLGQLAPGSPLAFVLAALAGFLLALTPTVLATVPVVMGYIAGEPGLRRWKALTRSLAFVLGTATTFGSYGLIFGWAGTWLTPLFGSNGYVIAGVVMVLLGLAMLGKLRLRVPVLAAPERHAHSFLGAYLLGLPFGFVGSACPCSMPVVLALLLYAGLSGSAWFGAALLFVFALVRSLPLVLAGTFTGLLKDLQAVARWQSWLEKASGLLLLVFGVAFVAQRFGPFPLAVVVAVTLLSVLAASLYKAAQRRTHLETAAKDENAPVEETEILVPGMVCEGCADTLSKALLVLQAVHKVESDVKQKRVRVFYNPQRTSADRLRHHVEELGFL